MMLINSNLPIRLELAQAYRLLGQNAKALELARSVEAWAHGGSSIEAAASKMVAELLAAEAKADTQPSAPTVGAGNDEGT
jgi:hypothetical protein